MARALIISSSLLLKLILVFYVLILANAQGLKVGFYTDSCPDTEAIVKKTVDNTMAVAPSLSGPLLRMFFHDCFVNGCDGSVLLNSSTKQAEKDAIPNLSLRGFQIIDRAKTALEKQCPGVVSVVDFISGIVSCSDIVALIARDVTVAMKGPHWEVETGRRDGLVSVMTDALTNLPPFFANISTLKSEFQKNGLSVKDLAVLSGAHTLGVSHCSSFDNRLYNFTGKGDSDPTMDPNYVKNLKIRCKAGDQKTIITIDGSYKNFDTNYYTNVAKRRGLFESDSALLNDPETKAYVQLQSKTQGSTFFDDFGVSMINMGRIGVLTGNNGEVRKICSKIN